MARQNHLLAMRQGSLKTWLKIITDRLQRDRTPRAVFLSVGLDLQAAMIAAEVISIMRQQADEAMPIELFNELYMQACRLLIPDYYTPEAK